MLPRRHEGTTITHSVLAALWLTACLLLAYLPDVGHGFIKDDYGWIASSHLTSPGAVLRLFTDTPMGFYRPLVSLSFGVTEWLGGNCGPLPYALTNLALVAAIGGAIWFLASRLGLPAGAALFAAAVWVFNFHGINMSVLWISGRTSLLGTLFAVLAAGAFASSRVLLAGTLTLAALLSKEEPLLLPLVFLLWTLVDGRRVSFAALWPSFVAVAIYLALRAQTPALTPSNAPDFYRLSVAAIGGNLVQYADRSMTFPAALLLLGALGVSRSRWHVSKIEWNVVRKGAIWLVLGFALTIMVPVRSSLYVCLPAVGVALAAGALGAAWWRAMRHPQWTLAVVLALPLALWPVYHSRNARIRNEATLASDALATIAERVHSTHPSRLVIVSTPVDRPSMADAFAGALPTALHLFVPEAAGTEVVIREDRGDVGPGDVTYEVRGSRLVSASEGRR